MKITLVSSNVYLFQKIRLLCPEDELSLSERPTGDFDKLIWDADTALGNAPKDAITVSRHSGSTLNRQFGEGELHAALNKNSERAISVEKESRTVILRGRRIKLTEVEFALLWELYSADGAFVPRGELIRKVWGNLGNDSLINVYVHYLREKLETGSQRLIFSSRKEGYKLDISEDGIKDRHRP